MKNNLKRTKLLQQKVDLTNFEKALINRLQLDLPLVERPFIEIAQELNSTEQEVIETVNRLRESGVLTRFGPLFDISKAKGHFSLCALAVPENRIDEVAELVNARQSVAHNYLRENQWNMWFVLAAKSEQLVNDEFDAIVAETGCPGINCPKEKEFYVKLILRA